MIVFDLRCRHAHVFEAWFGSSADYESQTARNLIACPACGDTAIGKAVMAPAVAAKGNRSTPRPAALATGHPAEPASTPPGDDGFSQILAAQRRMEAACDYVGSNFARRARAIHDGTDPTVGIYGEATTAEAMALIEDGIPVLPLPFRPLACADA